METLVTRLEHRLSSPRDSSRETQIYPFVCVCVCVCSPLPFCGHRQVSSFDSFHSAIILEAAATAVKLNFTGAVKPLTIDLCCHRPNIIAGFQLNTAAESFIFAEQPF